MLSVAVLCCCVAVVASARPGHTHAHGLDAETLKRKKELLDQYHLASARKKGAIDDALKFLMSQESQEKRLEDQDAESTGENIAAKPTGDQLPLCQVSADNIRKELTFVFNNASTAPYDHHCWLMRTRYNVAEVCEKEEQDRGETSLWQWDWTFSSAQNGKCRMPDPSPPAAAKEYLRQNPKMRRPRPNDLYQSNDGNVLNIMALGLSFMGQTIMSLACLNDHLVSGGYVSIHEAENGPPTHGNVQDIRNDGGVCTGYRAPHIADMMPAAMNPSRTLPKQNVYECSADDSLVEYVNARDPSLPRVRLCYVYTFNVGKNWKAGAKPCGWSWTDTDIVLGFMEFKDYKNVIFPRSHVNIHELGHLKIVNVMNYYAALIYDSMRKVAKRSGKSVVDIRAKPSSCIKPDIHYRLPGVPDVAIQLWFSMIATGLNHFTTCQIDVTCSPYTKKIGAIEYWE